MIPQAFPLYAIDTTDSMAYVVIGWHQSIQGGEMIPALAPMDSPACVWPQQGASLVFSTEAPASPRLRMPATDETVVMKSLAWPPR
jgi:hypothetical protein